MAVATSLFMVAACGGGGGGQPTSGPVVTPPPPDMSGPPDATEDPPPSDMPEPPDTTEDPPLPDMPEPPEDPPAPDMPDPPDTTEDPPPPVMPEPPDTTEDPPAPDMPEPPVSPAARLLDTPRFTKHQPLVLEQIGAHHAYASGLTGRGVRIGIDDTIVDYTQNAEFGNRVLLRDEDGAKLLYSRPLGDFPSIDPDVASCSGNPACKIWVGDSADDDEAYNRWVRQIVDEDGWPTGDDSVFVLDEHYPEDGTLGQLLRWYEVPTPYGSVGFHGTAVASIAAGTNLGVAPEATIIPVANNLTPDQYGNSLAEYALRDAIEALPVRLRLELDDDVARGVRANYANFDIINRSYGVRVSEVSVINSVEDAIWYLTYMPNTLDARWQRFTPDSKKTIVVYAAGNNGDPVPGLGAALPYIYSELRGHTLAVAATDPQTGLIADYSNRCGPLPSDWSTYRHGRHYCLVAPGTVQGLVPNASTPGQGDVRAGLDGTSFAAPVVSGALALLMEHFRGTRGNTEIAQRMLDTADRTGPYADAETYGAGHLDLEAALSPVGVLSAGQSAQLLQKTTLQTPAAFGALSSRVAGLELAAFDQQDFPFWVPVSALISTQGDPRTLIPRFDQSDLFAEPATGLDVLGLNWAPVGAFRSGKPLSGSNWVTGIGATSASLAYQADDSGWGYGLSIDGNRYLGATSSGAFGSDLHSSMVWTSRRVRRDLGDGWKMEMKGTLGLSAASYENDAIFQTSPSVLSAFSATVGTRNTQLSVEQPLRAESGTGTFRVENGWTENGNRLYDVYRIPLRPDAREIRMTLRHEQEAIGGRVALQVGGALNSGHVQGENEVSLGFAYRYLW